MNPRSIRPLALCIFKKDETLLVAKGFDHKKKKLFTGPWAVG